MNTRTNNARLAACAGLLVALLLGGCQSTGGQPANAPNTAREERPERGDGPTSITFGTDPDMLSAILRQAGPSITRGGIAIMNGAGPEVVPAQEFRKLDTTAFAQQLARAGKLEIATAPTYHFLYSTGYEALASAQYPLHPKFHSITTSVDFGEGTRLYNVLAILSALLHTTLIADNIVAENPCGEIALRGIPLDMALEAILRSARITPDAVRVESTDDYVFLRAASNTAAPDLLLNEAELGPAERAALDARVSVVLPDTARRPGAAVFVDSAVQLGDILASLGKQLGIPVVAPGLERLPVNYTVINDLPIRSALDLLLRQWPTPDFGYAYSGGTITLRQR